MHGKITPETIYREEMFMFWSLFNIEIMSLSILFRRIQFLQILIKFISLPWMIAFVLFLKYSSARNPRRNPLPFHCKVILSNPRTPFLHFHHCHRHHNWIIHRVFILYLILITVFVIDFIWRALSVSRSQAINSFVWFP